jgi:integrase
MQVKLREKPRKNGGASFYLDIYSPGQKRKYEFLNLILVKPKNSIDRDLNKQTRMQAEALRAKRQIELQSSTHGLISPASKQIDFLKHFAAETEERYNIDVDYTSWISTLQHLKRFLGENIILMHEIDKNWLEQFKKHLLYKAKKSNLENISQNTAHHYFNRVLNCLKEAYSKRLIPENPTENVDYIEKLDTKKEFLSIEELQILADTKCRYPILKSAFLFSCLTGMRFGDIHKLTWSEVRHSEANGWGIYFTQEKTEGVEFLPISDQARKLLPEKPGRQSELVFTGLKYSGHYNDELSKWAVKAGITKHITFHCGRHTAATLLLSNDVDIYTVSKILGHKNLKTTEIYAKLVSSKRIAAVNKIPQLNF